MAKLAQVTTPKGTAIYPHLNKADAKFGDPVYKTDLKIPLEHTDQFQAKIQDVFEEFFADKKESEAGNYADIYAEDLPFYEEDGFLIVRTKLNKIGKNRKDGSTWENKIAFYDSQRQPIPRERLPLIGGASILRVSCEIVPYAMAQTEGKGKNKVTNLGCGISLRIVAVMVIEARNEVPEKSAAELGFDEDEDGYSYDPNAVDPETGEADEDF